MDQEMIIEQEWEEQLKTLKSVLCFLEVSRKNHYYCEDCYYTCPAHPEELEYYWTHSDNKCNCGANEFNIELDKIIILVKQHLNV